MIEPVFEDLARSKKNSTTGGAKAQAEGQIAFVKVDLSVGMASMVAREYGVAATPTFGFFLDGKKVRAVRSRSRLFHLWAECSLARRLMN
jgi:hypothetical protein